MYMDGIERMWSRRTMEDYWQKELQHIGQQELLNKEVYAQGTSADDDVFGYQDRYDEYRYKCSHVSGEFRSVLDYWHMGRKFSALPTLNPDFINCDPGKRYYADQVNDSLWCMTRHSVQARRLVDASAAGSVR